MAGSTDRPLQEIAKAFSDLASGMGNANPQVQVSKFARACSHVSILFGCLGFAFKFAERDYVSKVQDLEVVSKNVETLQSLIELDVRDDCVREPGSHSRNLLRVKRGLDMVKVLFQGILDDKDSSLKHSASHAYAQVFAPYHSFPIRTAVAAGFYTLPTRSQLLDKLNEDETSAKDLMQEYIVSVDPVIKYVDDLFLVRGLGIDW